MKITPIEIRQKTFEKGFRGYEKDDVNAFLLSMSQEWEKLLDENKEYKMKLDLMEKESRKLKEVENSLYRTLKTAEDTGSHLIEQANKSADLHLVEAKQKAEIMLTEAQNRAKNMVLEADKKAKQALEDMLNELKSLERDFRTMENLRDNMLFGLKSMANDTLERVARLDAKNAHISFDSKIREIKDLLDKKSDSFYIDTQSLFMPQEETKPESKPELPPVENSKPDNDVRPTGEAVKAATVPEEKPAPLVVAEETRVLLQVEAEQPEPAPTSQSAPVTAKKSAGSFFDELEAE